MSDEKSLIEKLVEANPETQVIKDPFRAQISTDGLLFLTFSKETITKLLAAAKEKGEAIIVVNTTKLLAH